MSLVLTLVQSNSKEEKCLEILYILEQYKDISMYKSMSTTSLTKVALVVYVMVFSMQVYFNLQLMLFEFLHFIASRLSNVNFLTNNDSTSVAPNTGGNGGWSICKRIPTSLGVEYNVTCNINHKNPILRQLSVAGRVQVIELREVMIYGHSKFKLVIVFLL